MRTFPLTTESGGKLRCQTAADVACDVDQVDRLRLIDEHRKTRPAGIHRRGISYWLRFTGYGSLFTRFLLFFLLLAILDGRLLPRVVSP